VIEETVSGFSERLTGDHRRVKFFINRVFIANGQPQKTFITAAIISL